MPRTKTRFQLYLRGRSQPFKLVLKERIARIEFNRGLMKRALTFVRETIPATALLPKPPNKGVAFTGSREGVTKLQAATLKRTLTILLERNSRIFRHGDCVGADEKAHKQAKSLNADIVIYPPKNKSMRAFCEDARFVCKPDEYIARNHKMVDHSAVLVATPSTKTEELRSGTWATVRYARKLGRPVYLIYPDGSLEAQFPDLDPFWD